VRVGGGVSIEGNVKEMEGNEHYFKVLTYH
jgi:hypothetical protein